YSSPPFALTFAEYGLPSGTPWSVGANYGPFNATVQSSTASSMVFDAFAGFYSPWATIGYSIPASHGYSPTPSSGNYTIASLPNGSYQESYTVNVSFRGPAGAYPVVFAEQGLPTGTNWTIEVDGMAFSSASPNDTVLEANGSHVFAIPSIPGYSASPASGSFSVGGAGFFIPVNFTGVPAGTATATFEETGLPNGTLWGIDLNGANLTTTNSEIVLQLVTGWYNLSALPVAGFHTPPGVSQFYLLVRPGSAGYSKTIIPYTAVYSLEFLEYGLPIGTNWSVTLDGSTATSSGAAIVFGVTAGNHTYSAASANAIASPSNGTLAVRTNLDVSIVFAPHSAGPPPIPTTYALSFSESGLPQGTLWSVTVNGVALSSDGSQVGTLEINGSYWFSAANVPGYRATPSNGTVVVAGLPVGTTVVFSTNPPPPGSGGGGTTAWSPSETVGAAIAGGIAAGVAAGVATSLMLDRGRRPNSGPPSAAGDRRP
ncbi:MAG: hypothetical protein L3K09_02150, partial [Thermoplasmata archaeon]|nr:hypothetical protein [Thermoplasmata archaeon]